ncbi:hypothetical protein [Mycobacterium paraterrae]|uniref:Uncharacterized protein n=1 Tax=Mycobacterium paraterrae TaxID=577492 RepID=A0ABY3VJI3_9MYCO|nr:hypothetical protein [Mycobacterium paraterrae]UMB69456.1 hypothetical protein MKK62_24480 [Mycobacterium paraterrae]
MGHYDPALSYDEMLQVFKSSLGQALSGNLLPHDSSIFNVTVILALLDVANAARLGRPTESLVTRATEAFAVFAADFAVDDETTQTWNGAARSRAVPSLKIAN